MCLPGGPILRGSGSVGLPGGPTLKGSLLPGSSLAVDGVLPARVEEAPDGRPPPDMEDCCSSL